MNAVTATTASPLEAAPSTALDEDCGGPRCSAQSPSSLLTARYAPHRREPLPCVPPHATTASPALRGSSPARRSDRRKVSATDGPTYETEARSSAGWLGGICGSARPGPCVVAATRAPGQNARHDGTPPHHVRDGTALVACDARANARAATRCGVFWGIGAVTLNVDTGLARRTEETQATLNLLTTLEHFVRSTRAARLQSPRRESRPIGRPRREQRWSRTITAAYGFDVVVATPHCAISPTPALAGFGMDEGDPNQVPQRGWQRSHPHVEVTYS